MNDRLHNKNLEELLKQNMTKKSADLDDFDREALEGFALLHSEEEAMSLKGTLDKRISEEVFTDKKNNPKVYWFAAAGLFLVIGLSIYFILNNQSINQKDVALVPAREIKNLEEEKEISVPTEKPTPVAAAEQPKSRQQNTEEDNSPGKKRAVLSPRSVIMPAQNPKRTNENSIAFDKRDDKDFKPVTEVNQQGLKDANLDNVNISTKNSEGHINDESVNAKEPVADQVSESKAYDKEVTKKSAVKDGKEKRKENPYDDNLKDENKLASHNTGGSQPVFKSAHTEAGTANNIPMVSSDNKSAPSSPELEKTEKYNSPANSCYYVGGETDLIKDVREKLLAEQVNKKFDVVLNVDEKKQVVNVKFLNAYDLTTKEKNKVSKVLKSLSKFNFYIQPNTKLLSEFKLEYRP
ncbi:MAG: hypothetical protein JWO32_1620 [Bacteroidetes bacterium]|nr:hypothetical protein [Bacteroidota bacterium]